jgi:hypothetical protein
MTRVKYCNSRTLRLAEESVFFGSRSVAVAFALAGM